MKNSFDKTIDVLVKAYLHGILTHQSACACVVGNLIADACGYTIQNGKYFQEGLPILALWVNVHAYDPLDQEMVQYSHHLADSHYYGGLKQLNATGYTPEQTARIEHAFEHTVWGPEGVKKGYSRAFVDSQGDIEKHIIPEAMKDEAEFAGLMAVVDVLQEIHGISNEDAKEAKSMFKKEKVTI